MSVKRHSFEKTFFLDRTHGKRTAAILRSVGFAVRSIYEEYPNGQHESVDDPTWIRLCAQNDWVALSGDKKIRTNPLEKQAILDSKLRVFIFTDTNSLPEEWAAAVIVGSEKIQSVVRKNEGPFYAMIGKRSDGHVTDARFFQQEYADDETDEGQNEQQETR